MPRTVYLIRHAMPDIPIGERWCIGGRTDLPLGDLGRLQAALLSFQPELKSLSAVFCSKLIRARETALPLSPAPRAMSGLEEQDMGEWDGLPFSEIKARFPALYAAREQNADLLPEGAESGEALRGRMKDAVYRCLNESVGDIAVVSHKSAIAALTGQRSRLGYASVTPLVFDGDSFSVEAVGIPPHPALTDAVCFSLLRAAGADEKLMAHCLAVAEQAVRLCDAVHQKGLSLDRELIGRAALLHDLAKGRPRHPALGAVWLTELGYPDEAALVRQHNEPEAPGLNEAAIVFLADKTVRGDTLVTLEDRFAATRERCRTPEAREAHCRRLNKALALKKELNTLCAAELIR